MYDCRTRLIAPPNPSKTHTRRNPHPNQAEKIALQENPERIRYFLKKIGSNPLLRDRALSLVLKKPWRVVQKWHSVSLCDTLAPAVSGESENWRCLFENIRTELAGLGGRNSPHTPLPPASPCLPDR